MNTRLRFNTAEAAEYAGRHPGTIRRALESGELHGGQPRANAHWSIRLECLEAWLDGELCEHRRKDVA